MDDKTKCFIGIVIVFIIIALIMFWPSTTEASETYIKCYTVDGEDGDNGTIVVKCLKNTTDNETVVVENTTVYVNLTYVNNTTVTYEYVTDSNGKARINDLPEGTYTIAVYLPGNETIKESTFTKTVHVKVEDVPAETTTQYETQQETEYETDYDTEYETYYDTEYETYTEPETYTTYRYYWVYV